MVGIPEEWKTAGSDIIQTGKNCTQTLLLAQAECVQGELDLGESPGQRRRIYTESNPPCERVSMWCGTSCAGEARERKLEHAVRMMKRDLSRLVLMKPEKRIKAGPPVSLSVSSHPLTWRRHPSLVHNEIINAV
ncbi:hypothetical protein E1301_Tti014846 [Triplophysa tibetana]|uniref:Uncharacterized protein n=1 Tax=Triplophysa tibetana TaxID=1572043 RepID=A0A5A9NC51_9TELE|nr:hypothetical protein E1301_Tti014846 [Triplophysa tibetana]